MARSHAKQTDPLGVIPTTQAVRRWLTEAETRAQKLRVLLRTAEEIEAAEGLSEETVHAEEVAS